MKKIDGEYQKKYETQNINIYDRSVLMRIDDTVKLHKGTETNGLSSSAACLNVLGSISNDPEQVKEYLNSFGLNIEQIIQFPTGADIGGLKYNDKGYVVFEWIGPKESPINERGGGRGLNRTSIDAYVIAKINGIITQLLIEWKFTEGKSRSLAFERFSGFRGLERLRRYSEILVRWRNTSDFPFNFQEDGGLGICDFSVDHLYQLLRMTLLAKTTTPSEIGPYKVEDYRILHLTHSENDAINIIGENIAEQNISLKKFKDRRLHDMWIEILADRERSRFIGDYWNKHLDVISDIKLRNYLTERYG